MPRRPAYYWWFLANVLAACFAVVSWFLCLHIFGNPEIPRNYRILKKLDRLPELKRYTVLDVPNGNVLDPSELYGKFFGLEEANRDQLNALLLRNYMRNFEKTLLLTYVEGEYQVADVKKLAPGDFLYPGFAIRAQAMVKPDDFTEAVGFPVVIEYIFPTENAHAADLFSVGDILKVSKNPNCAAVVNVSRAVVDEEPALQLTVIPIAYGPYRIGKDRSFSIEPPAELNPGDRLPIWK
ncbi:hypothetical protein ACFSSA_14210 [Luteolibacter algae]|uniref:SAF domain-containing protein n=1 Tax=Luteolibacter algae TaxID=454151 RepID=A0ABW5DA71_9BACT